MWKIKKWFLTLTCLCLSLILLGTVKVASKPAALDQMGQEGDIGQFGAAKALKGEIKTEYFTLYYDPKFKEDALKEKHYLEQTIEALKKEFSSYPVEELLKIKCTVVLYPQRTDRISEGSASIESGSENGQPYWANIELLTPSQYDPAYRNSLGLAFSDDGAFKLIAHEYSTILFERITAQKKRGIKFHKCPRWFTQGYEEYCGLVLSSPYNRSDLVNKYLSFFTKDKDRVDFDFGINVKNDYIDGAMLVLFMNESFGKNRVQEILASPESSFGKAIGLSLGVDLPQFADRFHKWLAGKLVSLNGNKDVVN
jgi:hypothetical protein